MAEFTQNVRDWFEVLHRRTVKKIKLKGDKHSGTKYLHVHTS